MGLSICYRKSNDGFLEQVPTAWISNANACKEGLEREVINSLGGDCCDRRDASPSNRGWGVGVLRPAILLQLCGPETVSFFLFPDRRET